MIDEKNTEPDDDAVDEDPEYQKDLPDPDVHLDAEPDTDIPDDEGDDPKSPLTGEGDEDEEVTA